MNLHRQLKNRQRLVAASVVLLLLAMVSSATASESFDDPIEMSATRDEAIDQPPRYLRGQDRDDSSSEPTLWVVALPISIIGFVVNMISAGEGSNVAILSSETETVVAGSLNVRLDSASVGSIGDGHVGQTVEVTRNDYTVSFFQFWCVGK